MPMTAFIGDLVVIVAKKALLGIGAFRRPARGGLGVGLSACLVEQAGVTIATLAASDRPSSEIPVRAA